MKYLAFFYLLVLCCSPVSISQEIKTGGTISGYLFGDYFYKVKGTAALTGVSVSQYSGAKKTEQAFQLRRMYLYYDYIFNETFSSQILVEGNDKTLIGGKMSVFVKTSFLEWKKLIPEGSLYIGLVPTPTWSTTEKIWNYRSIEKSIIDYRGLGIGSDLGISVKGKLDGEGMFHYAVMFGNGTGQKPENNKYKKYYFSLSAKPFNDFIVEGYFDFEPNEHQLHKTTRRIFCAYQSSIASAGLELVQQTQRKSIAAGGDIKPFGISFFAWAPLPKTEHCNTFFRFDTYNPNTETDIAGFNETFVTLGFDYMPIPNVHIMPNIWINSFSEKSSVNAKKDSDIVARLTFYYVNK
ncbi:MAG: hypothetical protein FJ218_04305 [Ignavibacteria bacterium]|nr:hypothetical protein [Ignavibacteria bacterium]